MLLSSCHLRGGWTFRTCLPAHNTHALSRRRVPAPRASSDAAGAGALAFPEVVPSEGVSFPLTLPMLPFPVEEVLLPGSVKVLHLFEPRYLALLDEVLRLPGPNKLFIHVVVEEHPLGARHGDAVGRFPGSYAGDGFVLRMATLCRVQSVKPLSVGALVKIQAEARVEVTDVTQLQPFIRGCVVLLRDDPLPSGQRQQVAQQMQLLQSTMQDLQNLTMKFKTKQTAAIQQAMLWWYRQPLVPAAGRDSGSDSSSSDSDDLSSSSSSSSSSSRADLPEQALRLSFAALQAVPEASPQEADALVRCCVSAMETRGTQQRLSLVQQHMDESCKLLAAKCALKSLHLPGVDW